MISNPASLFINGNEKDKFTYEGGTTLYHFSPHDNNLSNTMENNIIFFANNEEHAFDVLKRLCNFVINCEEKYLNHTTNKRQVHWREFSESSKMTAKKFHGYLEAIEENKIKLELAPINQIYIVGWASNDHIY